jgi:hypothetical protein
LPACPRQLPLKSLQFNPDSGEKKDLANCDLENSMLMLLGGSKVPH